MKIKKILLVTVAVILAVSTISRCSIFSENNRKYIDITTIASVEDFKALISPMLDLSLYNVTEDNDELGIVYEMKEEYRKQKSYNFTHTLSLGDGTGFTLPVTIGELQEQGWTITENINAYGSVYMLDSQGNKLKLQIDPSSINGNIDEYTVNGYEIKTEPTETNKDSEYTVYDKLTNESDFIEIIEHLGAPTTVIFDIDPRRYLGNEKVVRIDLLYLDNDNHDNMTYFEISRSKELSEYEGYILDHNCNYTSITVRDE